ncbi:Putative electron transport protein YccM [Stieleria maiorica]|uniref:Electron transport protein YccM n=1 Tax=Stieleria maiorica TaxID=2795974 RepID=A0A5B9MAA5_9BACT|nr:4Fe-4S binding protein [Stieleria maiorica]QEF97613.1 Putative electron transport protein YccM [Stieleria maiorica]
MKRRGLSLAVALLAAAAILTAAQDDSIASRFGVSSALMITVAAVVLAAAVLVFLTSFDRGNAALIRLDWFSPALRRLKPHQYASHSLTGRLLRRLVPDGLQSDRMSKQRGVLRKMLRRFGLSWLASPVRRIVQSICLVTFAVLFFYVCWPYDAQPAESLDAGQWPSHYSDNLAAKEVIPAESFLMIDPLVSLSTAIASRSWVWSLVSAAAILVVCVLIPRGFCGYLCPLGTTIDLFDWAVGKRVTRFRVTGDGWWVHIKYYLLAGTLLCSVLGVLVSGFFSAIPVITRGMLFLLDPIQSGMMRGWHLVPAMNAGHLLSIAMFVGVLSLGFLRPRFWCKYVCPSGAVFSLGNLFRITERKVESSCINCNKCVEICPFDAIKPDFTTRTTDCTLCQSCGGVCPTHAIKFVERWNVVELKVENDPPTHETALGRRGFLSLAGGTAAAVAGGAGVSLVTKTFGANLNAPDAFLPVRPPGSVPEQEFLEMCIRCGECFKACPNNVLQPEGFQQGLEGLWSPLVNADWAGCESSCNACGQVCPTGAIRALPLAEKKVARMGLAIVNESTCLPFAGAEECDLCVQECNAAGYHAIEFKRVGTEVDDNGVPIEGTGYSAPVVLADKCVGCGLCQTRCNAINVKERGLLGESAIIIQAGKGKEDRMMSGSYVALREQEARQRTSAEPGVEYFVPETGVAPSPLIDESPFGVEPSGGDESPFGVPASDTIDDDPFGTLE